MLLALSLLYVSGDGIGSWRGRTEGAAVESHGFLSLREGSWTELGSLSC